VSSRICRDRDYIPEYDHGTSLSQMKSRTIIEQNCIALHGTEKVNDQ